MTLDETSISDSLTQTLIIFTLFYDIQVILSTVNTDNVQAKEANSSVGIRLSAKRDIFVAINTTVCILILCLLLLIFFMLYILFTCSCTLNKHYMNGTYIRVFMPILQCYFFFRLMYLLFFTTEPSPTWPVSSGSWWRHSKKLKIL